MDCVNFICVFQPGFAGLHMALHLPELLQLSIRVRIQFSAHVLHPRKCSTVLVPLLLHSLHCPESVLDCPLLERFHLLKPLLVIHKLFEQTVSVTIVIFSKPQNL